MQIKSFTKIPLRYAKNEYQQFKHDTYGFKNRLVNNYKIGKRLSERKGYSTIPTVTGSIIKKTKIGSSEMPPLIAVIGMLSPLPGGTVIGYFIGKLIAKFAKFCK